MRHGREGGVVDVADDVAQVHPAVFLDGAEFAIGQTVKFFYDNSESRSVRYDN